CRALLSLRLACESSGTTSMPTSPRHSMSTSQRCRRTQTASYWKKRGPAEWTASRHAWTSSRLGRTST
ncbi:unnamed protein product, partial [Ectocarpus fasciculatus]